MLKKEIYFALASLLLFCLNLSAEDQKPLEKNVKILFLHHSTGENIWNGGIEKCFNQYNKKIT